MREIDILTNLTEDADFWGKQLKQLLQSFSEEIDAYLEKLEEHKSELIKGNEVKK